MNTQYDSPFTSIGAIKMNFLKSDLLFQKSSLFVCGRYLQIT